MTISVRRRRADDCGLEEQSHQCRPGLYHVALSAAAHGVGLCQAHLPVIGLSVSRFNNKVVKNSMNENCSSLHAEQSVLVMTPERINAG